jgi:glycosyltransferase involved in cell wall biosynthesis
MQNNGSYCDACSGFKFYNAALKRCNRNSLSRSLLSAVESYVSLFNGSIESFDQFIAVSDFLKDEVIKMGLPKDKIVTIHNPIDTVRRRASPRLKGYYLYYGRIELNKGIPELLRAFANFPSKELLIVGSGSAVDAVNALITELSLENVTLLGHCSGARLDEIIMNAYSVIVPSTWAETFGLTAAEAMAYGKPVIASAIGGLPEVIGYEGAGILVTPGDVDQLSDAIERLSSAPSEALIMGENARDRVVSLFSQEVYYKKMMSLYESFL